MEKIAKNKSIAQKRKRKAGSTAKYVPDGTSFRKKKTMKLKTSDGLLMAFKVGNMQNEGSDHQEHGVEEEKRQKQKVEQQFQQREQKEHVQRASAGAIAAAEYMDIRSSVDEYGLASMSPAELKSVEIAEQNNTSTRSVSPRGGQRHVSVQEQQQTVRMKMPAVFVKSGSPAATPVVSPTRFVTTLTVGSLGATPVVSPMRSMPAFTNEAPFTVVRKESPVEYGKTQRVGGTSSGGPKQEERAHLFLCWQVQGQGQGGAEVTILARDYVERMIEAVNVASTSGCAVQVSRVELVVLDWLSEQPGFEEVLSAWSSGEKKIWHYPSQLFSEAEWSAWAGKNLTKLKEQLDWKLEANVDVNCLEMKEQYRGKEDHTKRIVLGAALSKCGSSVGGRDETGWHDVIYSRKSNMLCTIAQWVPPDVKHQQLEPQQREQKQQHEQHQRDPRAERKQQQREQEQQQQQFEKEHRGRDTLEQEQREQQQREQQQQQQQLEAEQRGREQLEQEQRVQQHQLEQQRQQREQQQREQQQREQQQQQQQLEAEQRGREQLEQKQREQQHQLEQQRQQQREQQQREQQQQQQQLEAEQRGREQLEQEQREQQHQLEQQRHQREQQQQREQQCEQQQQQQLEREQREREEVGGSYARCDRFARNLERALEISEQDSSDDDVFTINPRSLIETFGYSTGEEEGDCEAAAQDEVGESLVVEEEETVVAEEVDVVEKGKHEEQEEEEAVVADDGLSLGFVSEGESGGGDRTRKKRKRRRNLFEDDGDNSESEESEVVTENEDVADLVDDSDVGDDEASSLSQFAFHQAQMRLDAVTEQEDQEEHMDVVEGEEQMSVVDEAKVLYEEVGGTRREQVQGVEGMCVVEEDETTYHEHCLVGHLNIVHSSASQQQELQQEYEHKLQHQHRHQQQHREHHQQQQNQENQQQSRRHQQQQREHHQQQQNQENQQQSRHGGCSGGAVSESCVNGSPEVGPRRLMQKLGMSPLEDANQATPPSWLTKFQASGGSVKLEVRLVDRAYGLEDTRLKELATWLERSFGAVVLMDTLYEGTHLGATRQTACTCGAVALAAASMSWEHGVVGNDAWKTLNLNQICTIAVGTYQRENVDVGAYSSNAQLRQWARTSEAGMIPEDTIDARGMSVSNLRQQVCAVAKLISSATSGYEVAQGMRAAIMNTDDMEGPGDHWICMLWALTVVQPKGVVARKRPFYEGVGETVYVDDHVESLSMINVHKQKHKRKEEEEKQHLQQREQVQQQREKHTLEEQQQQQLQQREKEQHEREKHTREGQQQQREHQQQQREQQQQKQQREKEKQKRDHQQEQQQQEREQFREQEHQQQQVREQHLEQEQKLEREKHTREEQQQKQLQQREQEQQQREKHAQEEQQQQQQQQQRAVQQQREHQQQQREQQQQKQQKFEMHKRVEQQREKEEQERDHQQEQQQQEREQYREQEHQQQQVREQHLEQEAEAQAIEVRERAEELAESLAQAGAGGLGAVSDKNRQQPGGIAVGRSDNAGQGRVLYQDTPTQQGTNVAMVSAAERSDAFRGMKGGEAGTHTREEQQQKQLQQREQEQQQREKHAQEEQQQQEKHKREEKQHQELQEGEQEQYERVKHKWKKEEGDQQQQRAKQQQREHQQREQEQKKQLQREAQKREEQLRKQEVEEEEPREHEQEQQLQREPHREQERHQQEREKHKREEQQQEVVLQLHEQEHQQRACCDRSTREEQQQQLLQQGEQEQHEPEEHKLEEEQQQQLQQQQQQQLQQNEQEHQQRRNHLREEQQQQQPHEHEHHEQEKHKLEQQLQHQKHLLEEEQRVRVKEMAGFEVEKAELETQKRQLASENAALELKRREIVRATSSANALLEEKQTRLSHEQEPELRRHTRGRLRQQPEFRNARVCTKSYKSADLAKAGGYSRSKQRGAVVGARTSCPRNEAGLPHGCGLAMLYACTCTVPEDE